MYDQHDFQPDMSINIFEPSSLFIERHGLLVAHSVSSCIEGQTIVQVMNPYETPIIVYSNETIAQMNPLIDKDVVSVIQPEQKPPAQPFIRKSPIPDNIMAELLDGVINLSKPNKEKLVKLLQKYSDIISSDKGDLGKTGLIKHSIRTQEEKLIKLPPPRGCPFIKGKRREHS